MNKIKNIHSLIKYHAGILFMCIIVFIASCKQPEEAKNSNEKLYFDLAAEVQKDIDSNSIRNCGEEKSVLVNDIKETKTISPVDWQKELLPISECDINKPAWKGKFSVDTMNNMMDGKTIQYHTLSNKINIRMMVVQMKNNQVEKITITKKINSFIFSSAQRIEYFPGKGFSVRGEQKAAMMKNFEINVDVKYSCK